MYLGVEVSLSSCALQLGCKRESEVIEKEDYFILRSEAAGEFKDFFLP